VHRARRVEAGARIAAMRSETIGAMTVAAIAVLVATGLAAQTAAPVAFDVASVKRSPDVSDRAVGPTIGEIQPGGVWRARDADIYGVIRYAYPEHATSAQIVGAPDWTRTEIYDIDARSHPAATPGDIRAMVRALLAERFRLIAHDEMREVPGYRLIRRAGAKLGDGLSDPAVACTTFRNGGDRPVDPSRRPQGDRVACGSTIMPVLPQTRRIAGATWRLTAGDTTIAGIVPLLMGRLGRPVVDGTGLTQSFDVELQFVTPAPGSDPDGPTLRTALAEQLGLELQDDRTSADVLVIDHIERPSAN
jgi:uncharacterized protein (TIGR03435 family)